MSKGSFLKPVKPDSLSRQVYDSLKEAIFGGRFQPGEVLRELHLAKMFEVSQATIREALVHLEQSGLVIREQNRKTSVTSLTRQEISDRLAIRAVLEEVAFISAARNMDDADIKRLSALGQTVQKSIEKASWRDLAMNDLRFHDFVWERAENPILRRTLEHLTTPLFAFLGVLHENGLAEVQPDVRTHEELVEALKTRDEEQVRRAVAKHVNASYDLFLRSNTPSLDKVAKSAGI